jgi:Tol biopolymer transport system component
VRRGTGSRGAVSVVIALGLLAGLASAVVLPAAGRAASRAEFGNLEIIAVGVTGRQQNLTQNAADDLAVAVARDGRIAFLTNRADEADLDVMNADGSGIRVVTSGVSFGEDLEWSRASWSPLGDAIAFDGLYFNADPTSCVQHCTGWRVLVIARTGASSGRLRSTRGRRLGLRTAAVSRTRATTTRTTSGRGTSRSAASTAPAPWS